LTEHLPVLRYDSQECYFADSAAEWTDHAGNFLKDAAGEVLASAGGKDGPADLSLEFIGPSYGPDQKADKADVISDPTRDYRGEARKLHADPAYGNRVYGRVKPDGDYRWLQYWFFYYYNDYNLLGHFLGAGRHEGDWEMIQIALGEEDEPTLAVFAQHEHAKTSDWDQVDLVPGTARPIVYVARGSHASYFETGYFHWTGHWWDHANGKRRRSPDLQLELVDEEDPRWHWVRWPGHWGDTKKGSLPFDSDSPVGPGVHDQWDNPSILIDKAKEKAAKPRPERPVLPPPPEVKATTIDQGIALEYAAPKLNGDKPVGLVVAVNSPDDERTPPTSYQLDITEPKGTVEVPEPTTDGKRYDVYVSLVTESRATEAHLSSEAIRRDLRPR
jgi:hypothetical protein